MSGDLAKKFKAIGNERRFTIMSHLGRAKELSVGQLSELIDLSIRSTSKHLMILAGSGLVASRQERLNKFYRVHPKLSKDIAKFFS